MLGWRRLASTTSSWLRSRRRLQSGASGCGRGCGLPGKCSLLSAPTRRRRRPAPNGPASTSRSDSSATACVMAAQRRRIVAEFARDLEQFTSRARPFTCSQVVPRSACGLQGEVAGGDLGLDSTFASTGNGESGIFTRSPTSMPLPVMASYLSLLMLTGGGSLRMPASAARRASAPLETYVPARRPRNRCAGYLSARSPPSLCACARCGTRNLRPHRARPSLRLR